MGLELVEFVMAVERSFGLSIPDTAASELVTPRRLVDHLQSRLPCGPMPCRSRRAFHRLRHAAVERLHVCRAGVPPTTSWESLMPRSGRERKRAWRSIGAVAGFAGMRRLGWFGGIPASQATVGDTARQLACDRATALLVPGEGWSRSDIESLVRTLVREELGVTAFEWDEEFVTDMGYDG